MGQTLKYAHLIFASTLLCSSCVVQPLSPRCTLILQPQTSSGSYATKTTVPINSQATINHLILKLYTVNGSETYTGIQKTIPGAQLGNAVVFAGLKANTTYRIKAYAYSSSDESTLISIDDVDSYTDITLTSDDRPTIASLKVKLKDVPFDGKATSSIAVTNGSLITNSTESMEIAQPIVTTYAGSNIAGDATGALPNARFNAPSKIVFDASGSLFITDTGNNCVKTISNATVATFATGITNPLDVVYYSNKIYVSKANSPTLYISDSTTGTATSSFSLPSTPTSLLVSKSGVTTAYIYTRLDMGGVICVRKGSSNIYSSGLGVTTTNGMIYNGDYLYVANTGANTVLKLSGLTNFLAGFTGALTIVRTYGDGTPGTADGVGTSAQFNAPRSLALDSNGNLFVADTGNHRIRLIDTFDNVMTYAGPTGSAQSGYADGQGTAALFNSPTGIVVDASGSLFVVDSGNNCIRKIEKPH